MADSERKMSLLSDRYDAALEARWDRIYKDSKPDSTKPPEDDRKKENLEPVENIGDRAVGSSTQIVPVQEELF